MLSENNVFLRPWPSGEREVWDVIGSRLSKYLTIINICHHFKKHGIFRVYHNKYNFKSTYYKNEIYKKSCQAHPLLNNCYILMSKFKIKSFMFYSENILYKFHVFVKTATAITTWFWGVQNVTEAFHLFGFARGNRQTLIILKNA